MVWMVLAALLLMDPADPVAQSSPAQPESSASPTPAPKPRPGPGRPVSYRQLKQIDARMNHVRAPVHRNRLAHKGPPPKLRPRVPLPSQAAAQT